MLYEVITLNVNDRDAAKTILNDLSGTVDNLAQTFVVNDPAQGFIDIQETIKQNLNFHQDDWAGYFKDNWNVTRITSYNVCYTKLLRVNTPSVTFTR